LFLGPILSDMQDSNELNKQIFMKKRFLGILLTGLLTLQLYAQQFQYTKVDFKSIKSLVSSESSLFYYPALFARYQRNDTTLNVEAFRYLYYGFTFQAGYEPYKKTDAETRVNELLSSDTLSSGDFSGIREACLEIIQLHPFSTKYLLALAVACSRLGNTEEARIYYNKYDGLLSAILSSGDGATEQSAWCVILVSDEYEILNALGFHPSGKQKLLSASKCDFIYVTTNEYAIEGFYFDISRPFAKGFN
jgi:hypothetical protein